MNHTFSFFLFSFTTACVRTRTPPPPVAVLLVFLVVPFLGHVCSQADMAGYLALIDDPDAWDERVRQCQACAVCGQTEKPLALEELNCVVCQCRIAKGGEHFFPALDAVFASGSCIFAGCP